MLDHYSTDNCSDTPSEEMVFIAPGQSGPQSCDGTPPCLVQALINPLLAVVPRIKTPLAANESYIDRLTNSKVPLRNPGGQTTYWHPVKTVQDRGELGKNFVRVPIAGDQYIAVRLSDGFGEMDKIDYDQSIPPRTNRKPVRPIFIGFETALPEGMKIEDLDLVKPTAWKRYSTSKTAFQVKYKGMTYYVATHQPVIVAP
jgi:hypothetical protein